MVKKITREHKGILKVFVVSNFLEISNAFIFFARWISFRLTNNHRTQRIDVIFDGLEEFNIDELSNQ